MRTGFSLVEILISILILALGVLGLGALFPAIIRQQREGSDAVNGVIAANSARSLVVGTDWESGLPKDWKYPRSSDDPPPPSPANAPPYPGFWELVREDQNGLYEKAKLEASKRGRWFIPSPILGQISLGNASNQRPYTGTFASYNKQPVVDISAWSRLLPSGGEADPQYVWDIALQLDPADFRNSPAKVPGVAVAQPLGRIRVAVFVRRVDPGIRVPPRTTLRSLLIPQGGATYPTLQPVSESGNGEPTFDGTGDYSPIRQAAAAFRHIPGDPVYARRDRLYIGGDMGGGALADARVVAALSQVNQKIVDNLGNVYTVIGFGSEGGNAPYLTIDPAVPASVPDPTTTPSVPPATDLMRFQRESICSVLFTLQVPASVVTVEIEP